MKKRAHNSNTGPLDVVVGGLAVVDVIGRPVDIEKMPHAGSLSVIDSVTLTTGGNVANVGIDLAKLGFRVGAITRIGDDAFGEFVRERLARHGIDCTGVIIDRRKQTSATIVAVSDGGERTFLHTRGCLEHFRVRDVLAHHSVIRRAGIFAFGYLGLLPEAEPEFARLFRAIKRKSRARILLDTGGNPPRDAGSLREFLPYVDYFMPSLDEAVSLTGCDTPEDIARYFFSAGAPHVVGVKLGARGCYIACDGRAEYIPPVKVRTIVDATGAGDAFVAGFLAATVAGRNPFRAAAIGNAVAAGCVTAVGASTEVRPLRHYTRT
ncbi:MAG: carbohydrate kinase family protein [Ignavibacteria bacterium]|nr:carbohydrate kinase family protein [Ignavibacteria bacterium]